MPLFSSNYITVSTETKSRNAKNDMRGGKVPNAIATANANMNAMPSYARLRSSFYLPPLPLYLSQLGGFRLSHLGDLCLSARQRLSRSAWLPKSGFS